MKQLVHYNIKPILVLDDEGGTRAIQDRLLQHRNFHFPLGVDDDTSAVGNDDPAAISAAIPPLTPNSPPSASSTKWEGRVASPSLEPSL